MNLQTDCPRGLIWPGLRLVVAVMRNASAFSEEAFEKDLSTPLWMLLTDPKSISISPSLVQILAGVTTMVVVSLAVLCANFINFPPPLIGLLAGVFTLTILSLALCINVRTAIVAAAVGSVANLGSSIFLATYWRYVPSLGGTSNPMAYYLCSAQLQSVMLTAASLSLWSERVHERPVKRNKSDSPARGSDLADVLLIVTVLAGIGIALHALVCDMLSGFAPKDVQDSVVVLALGTLLAGPLLLAVWRSIAWSAPPRNVSSALRWGLSAVAATCSVGTILAFEQSPMSIRYQTGVGILVGAICSGLFTLIWQWTDQWTSSKHRIAVSWFGTVGAMLSLLLLRAFGRNILPAGAMAVSLGSATGLTTGLISWWAMRLRIKQIVDKAA